MPVIRVARSFIYQPDAPVIGETEDHKPLLGHLPERVAYEAGGIYEVEEQVAEHWFVKAHLEGYEAPPPAMGTQQYQQAALLAARAARLNEPVAEMGPPAAPMPDGVTKAEPVTFAGGPVVDRQPMDRPAFMLGAPPR